MAEDAAVLQIVGGIDGLVADGRAIQATGAMLASIAGDLDAAIAKVNAALAVPALVGCGIADPAGLTAVNRQSAVVSAERLVILASLQLKNEALQEVSRGYLYAEETAEQTMRALTGGIGRGAGIFTGVALRDPRTYVVAGSAGLAWTGMRFGQNLKREGGEYIRELWTTLWYPGFAPQSIDDHYRQAVDGTKSQLLQDLESVADRGGQFLADHPGIRERMLGALPEFVGGVFSGFTGVPSPGPRNARELAGLLWLGLAVAGREPGHAVDVRPAGPAQVQSTTASPRAANPAAGIDRAMGIAADESRRPDVEGDPSEPTSQIRVEKIVRNGVTYATVYIPSTETWQIESKKPFDFGSNLSAAAGRETASREAVIEAMQRSGLDGGDTEVMLVGYSQGGLIAGSIAADPDAAQRFNVNRMLTAGAPADLNRDLAPGIEALSLDNSDTVAHADDGRNPATPNWTTVTVDPNRLTDENGRPKYAKLKEDQGVGYAHDVGIYKDAAHLVGMSDHGSTRHFLDGADPFLNPDGADVTVEAYTSKRVPKQP